MKKWKFISIDAERKLIYLPVLRLFSEQCASYFFPTKTLTNVLFVGILLRFRLFSISLRYGMWTHTKLDHLLHLVTDGQSLLLMEFQVNLVKKNIRAVYWLLVSSDDEWIEWTSEKPTWLAFEDGGVTRNEDLTNFEDNLLEFEDRNWSFYVVIRSLLM